MQFRLPRRRLRRGRSGAARHLRHRRSTPPTTWTRCLDGVPLGEISCRDERPVAVHAARLHARRRQAARHRRGASITGTSNQSDYISHFIANHMFYRLSLPGARRVLIDHIAFCRKHVPRWNPVSVVGQHMQQAGATPVETMAFTLSTALQYAQDCIDRGMDIDDVLRRFTFFFDISISLLRGDRQVPRRPPHLGAAGARAARRQGSEARGASNSTPRPRASISPSSSRSTTSRASPSQAMAGIMSGLQSLHTDAYDEAITDADRGDRAHRGRDAEHPARGGASVRRHRPARRLLLRRDADRPDGGGDRCVDRKRSTTPAACTRPPKPASSNP